MELSIQSNPLQNRCISLESDYSFPSSSFLAQRTIRNPRLTSSCIFALTSEPRERTKSVRERLREELAKLQKSTRKKKEIPPKTIILKSPSNSEKLARRLLSSPQLTIKSFPLLSSCLPIRPLTQNDESWMDAFLLEAKQALGYPLEPSEQYGGEVDNPGKQFDTVLYLALQYPACERTRAFPVWSGHTRLAFLGKYVLELASAEYLLQRYPRERLGLIRERSFGMIGKRNLRKRIKTASLQNLVFQYDDMDMLQHYEQIRVQKSVFSAIFGAIYVCFGMPEVYRVLSEAFGVDPDAEDCHPRRRYNPPDIDHLSPELEAKRLSWQDVAFYKPPENALFRHPRLFRACVPPGMHRFRGNDWDNAAKPKIMQALGYPLPIDDEHPEMTEARNIELGLGLQLCYMHPSLCKRQHPRFCFERLEYLGQKIQDLVMAEKLVMKYLDAPGSWLATQHRRLLLNKRCSWHLRAKNLQYFVYGLHDQGPYKKTRLRRRLAFGSVIQALHGLAYTVYGKPEIWRLMFEFFDFEWKRFVRLQHK